jgi:hypothetical protein
MNQRAWQQQRTGVEAILSQISGDPAFRQQLLSNPNAAIVALGQGDDESSEVVGYGFPCQWTCNWTCKLTRVTK